MTHLLAYSIAICMNAHGRPAARSEVARKLHDGYAAFRDRTAAWSRVSIKAVLEAREG